MSTLETSPAAAPARGIFTSERGVPTEFHANYQFPVERQPLVTTAGIELPDRSAIVRTDTGAVLGVVGSNYKMLTHAQALDPILDHLDSKGVKTFRRIALTDGGAKMFANIYFPANEMGLGHSDGPRDSAWPGISIVNSLDGTLKYQGEASIYRLACTNGMRIPQTIAAFTTVHSKNKNFTDLVEQILEFVSDPNKFGILQAWANQVRKPEAMGELARSIVEDKGCMFPERYLDLVLQEIEKETRFGVVSTWGLYNAFQSILEHHLVREKGKFERARVLEENLFKTFQKKFSES